MGSKNCNSKNIVNFLTEYTDKLKDGLDSIDSESLEKIANLIDEVVKNNKTIYTCGNGGSSAIADHFVCDFLKGSAADSTIQPIIHSLTSNTPTITAIANDISYDDIFSCQIEKYGNSDDILLSISSSGNSQNIIKAIEKAKAKNLTTISFVGFDGGKVKLISDYCIHIPLNNYGVVEDVHHSLMHILAQYIRSTNLTNEDNIKEIIF